MAFTGAEADVLLARLVKIEVSLLHHHQIKDFSTTGKIIKLQYQEMTICS